jgi:arginine-tRNA-protein transferase
MAAYAKAPLVPLPPQPKGVPFPTEAWPKGQAPEAAARVIKTQFDQAFGNAKSPMGETRAVIVIQGGRIVAEQYGKGFDEKSKLVSWSMAKSVTSLLVGIALDQGLIRGLDDLPQDYVPELQGTLHGQVPLRHLLNMSSGADVLHERDPVRIDVPAFAPSKSQRRAAKNAARLERVVGVPVVDDERRALYHRWHAHRETARGWDPSELDEERYAMDFAFPHPAAREVAFRDPEDGDRLVGLGIFDETKCSMSAVYFFWDPERAPPSLGVANVVTLVEDARAKALRYVYLGYRVLGCPSLVYKSKYLPHELLIGRPALGVRAVWKSAESDRR